MNESQTARSVWLGSVLWPKAVRNRSLSLGHRLTRLVFVVIGLLIAIGIYVTSVWFLKFCYQTEAVGPLLCRRLLDLTLLVLLSVLVLSNVVSALSSFFLAKDLDLLVTTPIPLRTLFGARFFEQILQSSWMVLAFGIPVLLAFAKVVGTPISYLAIFAVMPPLLILPAAAATILVLLLVSSLPAVRVRDLVLVLLVVAILVLYVLVRLLQPERFLKPEGFASVVSFFVSFSSPAGTWLPSYWGSAAIGGTFRDDIGAGNPLLMFALLWTSAGSAYVVTSILFRQVYASAFSRSQQGRTVARISRFWARLRGAPMPSDGMVRSPGRRSPAGDWIRAVGFFAPAGSAREFLIKDLKL
ncbi:MAG: hypothetical protein V1754_07095, partial [Pseudomonadota bacterium]